MGQRAHRSSRRSARQRRTTRSSRWTPLFLPAGPPECLQINGPRKYMHPHGWAGLGFSFPAGLGAKAGKPDSPRGVHHWRRRVPVQLPGTGHSRTVRYPPGHPDVQRQRVGRVEGIPGKLASATGCSPRNWSTPTLPSCLIPTASGPRVFRPWRSWVLRWRLPSLPARRTWSKWRSRMGSARWFRLAGISA